MQNKPLDRVLILNITIAVEAVLLLIATLWIRLSDIEMLPLFHLNRSIVFIGILGGLATAASGFLLLWLGNLFGSQRRWLRELRTIVDDELAPLFRSLSLGDIILIASCSSFCEEIFFRGVIQGELGLLLASVLFGFFHCPSVRHLPYGIWAICAGSFLGWLLILTGAIWAPIFAHALSNLVILLFLRFRRNKEKNDRVEKVSAESSGSSSGSGPE